jgi:3-methyladenine DNA glycosylase/8-oxoguanine DNA glycosylase
VAPRGHWRMPMAGRDGVLRRSGPSLTRLLHCEGNPVLVWARPRSSGVWLRAEAATRAAALEAIDRMRFALGVDHDLLPFHRRFRTDPLIGPVIRRRPWLRPRRRPEPFEALAWAICEQLIDSERAVSIQRRILARYGRRSACGRLRDVPAPAALAARAPAELQACGLSAGRALAMVKAAREVAAGRADLAEHERSWRRLRSISGIGTWTVEKLAFEGQGRDDQLPAGDLAYIKLVGRLAGLGRRATEEEVRGWFAPYGEYAGLAGLYALHRRYLGLTA